MLAELRTKSQITIPKDIVKNLGLSEGDKFDVFEKDGMICFVPVVVYPKKYIDELNTEMAELRKKVRSGKQPAFDNVDALFDKLEK